MSLEIELNNPPPKGLGWGALCAPLSALLLLLASPGNVEFPLLAWLALVPFLLRLPLLTPKRAFFFGLATGLCYYLPLLYWIIIVLSTYGQVPFYFAVPGLFFLALYMSLYTALFAFLGNRFSRSTLPLILWAPVLWVSLDFIRSKLLTGFPWIDLAYTQYSLPQFIQAADIFGHYGITFIIVLVNCLFSSLLHRFTASSSYYPSRSSLLASIAILVLFFSYNKQQWKGLATAMGLGQTARVTVVQGNIGQDKKWMPSVQQETIDTYIKLSRKAIEQENTELLIWPETALPFYPMGHPLFTTVTANLVYPYKIPLLTGAPHRQPTATGNRVEYFNSAFLIAPDGRVKGRYDKQHLVPFGEFIPFRSILAFASPVVKTLGDFSPGKPQPPLACQKLRIGVLICFESIFPDLAREQVKQGADLLVNITNDAWFGRSSAPHQHLAMAVFRAVENRRSLARAANTGISCFIGPGGRISQRSQLFSPFVGSGKLPVIKKSTTYVRWGHFFPLACLVFTLLLGVAARKQKKRIFNDFT